eukprot:5247447-Pyramimonas_sp.AAC.1
MKAPEYFDAAVVQDGLAKLDAALEAQQNDDSSTAVWDIYDRVVELLVDREDEITKVAELISSDTGVDEGVCDLMDKLVKSLLRASALVAKLDDYNAEFVRRIAPASWASVFPLFPEFQAKEGEEANEPPE